MFIHFDYARATARGYPFQWSEGNGFSSGNTSLTYPFVLAVGYLVGFGERSPGLMLWAAMVAACSTLGFFWALPRLFGALPRWTHLLAGAVDVSMLPAAAPSPTSDEYPVHGHNVRGS